MDLSYPADTEPFRAEIRQWLVDNLPEGWGTPGFSMTKDEKKAFNQEWTKKLFAGGWICASWPKEYGGKGLSLMESVVLNEEFARAEAPLRADFFGDTLVGPTILQWATEEQKQQFIPGILNGTISWCQGFSEPDAGSDLASLKTRAELDGDEWVDQRPEGVDHPGPVRRLHLPAGPHRSRRPQARRHLLPAGAHEAGRASRCGPSTRWTGAPTSTRSSSPTPAAPRRTWWEGSTTGGRWP